MKRLVIFGCIGTLIFGFAGSAPLVAQWQYVSGSSGPIVYNGGSVGVGTTSSLFNFTTLGPLAAYQGANTYVALGQSAAGAAYPTTYGGIWYDSTVGALRLEALSGGVAWRNVVLNGQGSGYVGIGTTAPAAPLSVLGNAGGEVARFVGSTDYANRRSFVSLFTSNPAFWWEFSAQDYLGGDAANGLAFRERSGSGSSIERVFLAPGGNVGIGTTQPAHLLHVNGTIGAKEVIVSSTGADYVFDSDYQLAPLSSVVDYIRANRHLPDIPSAAEAQANGMSVGEMQTKLLAKIEELTLYLAQSQQQISKLETEIRQIKADVR